MNYLLFFLLLFGSVSGSVQLVVNGQDINRLSNVEYIELIEDRRSFMQRQVFAVIDYGQPIRWPELRQHRVQNETGGD